jgi:hypothetical protein
MDGGRLPEQFSEPVYKLLKALSLGDVNLMGSNDDPRIMYSVDYDMLEMPIFRKSSVKQFQALVKRAGKVGTITDIKCGEIPEWNLLTTKKYSREKELKHLQELWQNKIITDAELREAQKLLQPNLTIPELYKARKALRFGIMRWTPAQVAQGSMKFRNHTVYLEEAMKSKGITKVDVVAWVKEKYVEVSTILVWTHRGKPYANVKNVVNALKEDLIVFAHDGNFMKVAKRLYSLAKLTGRDRESLERILNSHLGAVYLVVSDLKLLDEFPNAITPARKRKQLDSLRDQMSKLYFPEFHEATNPKTLLPKLEEKLQSEVKKELEKVNLYPIPKMYRD